MPVRLGDTIKADGRWRIFVFADAQAPSASLSRVRSLCDFLAGAPDSPVRRYTPAGANIDSVIDVRAVFQQRHRDLNIESMPQFLLPAKGRYGLRDYEKVFCSDHRGNADIFDLRSIERERGCAVVVRPDQYVANVLPLDAYSEFSAFFDGFML
jgi:phenol 2-monooxygenase